MDQPVAEDEHTEQVQDGDRKEKNDRARKGPGGWAERRDQTKQRQDDRVHVCLYVYIYGSLYDRFVYVNKYKKAVEMHYSVKTVKLEIFVYVRNSLKIDASDALLNPHPLPLTLCL